MNDKKWKPVALVLLVLALCLSAEIGWEYYNYHKEIEFNNVRFSLADLADANAVAGDVFQICNFEDDCIIVGKLR